MNSVQQLKSHHDMFHLFFRGIAHFVESAKNFCIYLLVSFEKAKRARIAYELDPYSSEEIKRIMLEE